MMKLNSQKKATNEILTQHVEADKVKTELTKTKIFNMEKMIEW